MRTCMIAATRVPIVDRTPMAKNSVSANEPKYARENGSRSVEKMCLRSEEVSAVAPCSNRGHWSWEDTGLCHDLKMGRAGWWH